MGATTTTQQSRDSEAARLHSFISFLKPSREGHGNVRSRERLQDAHVGRKPQDVLYVSPADEHARSPLLTKKNSNATTQSIPAPRTSHMSKKKHTLSSDKPPLPYGAARPAAKYMSDTNVLRAVCNTSTWLATSR